LLSKLYAKGYLVEKNHYKAIETVKKFAHEGNEKAMIQIADLNSCYGPEYNNFDEAEKWYKKAVNNYDGCSVEAPIALAKFYKRKYNDTGDPNSGVAYITHLNKMGFLGNVDAMHLLASEYKNGGFFQQDYHKALEWLKKAAETGDIRAHRSIGNYYLNGFFGDADYEQAAYWFHKAVQMGDRLSSEFLKSNPSPLGLEITKAQLY
jgi:TPR repeat protein